VFGVSSVVVYSVNGTTRHTLSIPALRHDALGGWSRTGNKEVATLRTIPAVLTQAYTVHLNLHYTLLLGIGSGHRQLIAVTCIAEHA